MQATVQGRKKFAGRQLPITAQHVVALAGLVSRGEKQALGRQKAVVESDERRRKHSGQRIQLSEVAAWDSCSVSMRCQQRTAHGDSSRAWGRDALSSHSCTSEVTLAYANDFQAQPASPTSTLPCMTSPTLSQALTTSPRRQLRAKHRHYITQRYLHNTLRAPRDQLAAMPRRERMRCRRVQQRPQSAERAVQIGEWKCRAVSF
ncbi:hypothetical protein BDV95DRAFT_69553 [Massariosphaeria phaeospora]|uniref:Uncharacterized protein n=1 Tax=Massariosphaeria phaeospora TaxID=100035 RepID=A0A7C8M588_9PLEO|nr:hypothetical protein BDV95DRAFT_69553 [Massariosphaeria phaeospora]